MTQFSSIVAVRVRSCHLTRTETVFAKETHVGNRMAVVRGELG